MKQSLLFLAGLLFLISMNAQTGPWAKYDAKMKGEALIRESDGGYINEMQSILDGGGDVNWQLQSSGLTPLMAAAAGGKPEVINFLLKNGANPDLKDANGRTALDRAKLFGAKDVVKLLSSVSTTIPASVPVKQEPVIAATEKPITAAQQPDIVKPTTKSTNYLWAPFGIYKVGDEVSFFNGRWNKGKIKEVGPAGNYAAKRALPEERKYLIARDGAANWNDWADWGSVTGLSREGFWTDFFIGEWQLGEVFAMNTRKEGAYQRDEYSFHGAKEALDIKANKTYRWKPMGGKIISGTWESAEDGAGIVLLKGFQGLNWTLRNETNATEENIRRIQSARLTAEGKMSIKAKRGL